MCLLDEVIENVGVHMWCPLPVFHFRHSTIGISDLMPIGQPSSFAPLLIERLSDNKERMEDNGVPIVILPVWIPFGSKYTNNLTGEGSGSQAKWKRRFKISLGTALTWRRLTLCTIT